MRSFFIGLFAVIGLITFIILAVMAWTLYRLSNSTMIYPSVPNNAVLTLSLGHGHLEEKPGGRGFRSLIEGNPLSLYSIIEGLEAAAKDPKVKGILLTLGNSGYATASVQELRKAFKTFKATGKFIYTYTDTFGELSNGTLGYYLASVSTKIWLMPLGSLNLTGFMLEVPFGKKVLEDFKIQPQLGRREEYKSVVESATESDFTPAHKENMTRIIDGLTTQILTDIAADRGISTDKMRELMDTAPHFPKPALEAKLIDSIGYKDDVKTAAEKKVGKKPDYMSFETYVQSLKESTKGERIAIIYGSGMITKNKGGHNPLAEGGVIDASEICKYIRQAAEEDKIKAIVLRIDSGGGDAIASDLIAREIILANAKKPVIVSMSNYAASGGYWIACDARKIVAQPGTITGSIGVFAGKVVTQQFWEHYGIHWGEIHNGANAGLWSTGQVYSEEGWKKLNGFLDQIYDTFLDKVAKGRHMDREKVRSIAKGQVWTGEEALKNGLVDVLGGLDTAIQVAKKEANIPDHQSIIPVHLPQTKSVMEMIQEYRNADEVELLSSSISNRYPTLGKILRRFDGVFSQPRVEAKVDKINVN